MYTTARGSTEYDTSNYGGCYSANVYSREHYQEWKTHEDQFTFCNREPSDMEHHQQLDGKGRRDRKTSASGATPIRKGELVGVKLPLRSSVSQPPVNHRRDEMVTAGSKVYSDRTMTSNYNRQQLERVNYQRSFSHNTHSSRPRSTESRHERKRSVSPQIERTKSVDPVSLTGYSTKKQVRKHIRKKIDLSSHTKRCMTFENVPSWPKDQVLIPLLASHGFYYTGQEDITQCFTCLEKVYDWNLRDDPLKRHFYQNPNCNFIRAQYHLDIEELCSEKFDIYSDAKIRAKSFNHWPIPRQVSTCDLVEAGWFYTGRDVVTQCFTCGCIYDSWRKGDNPMAIHKELSSKCSYLKQATCIDFSTKECRLQSFKLFTGDCAMTKEELVEAGFHLIGTHPMRVKCWSCDLVVESEWLKGDDPMRVHKLMRPTCEALQENMPKEEEETASFPQPFMTKTQLMKTYQSKESSEKKISKEESIASNVFDAPIYLPPRHFTHTTSFSSTHSLPQRSTTSNTYTEDIHSFSLPEDDKLCVVCLDNKKQYAIVPCGHLCVCQPCSQQLVFCPICRLEKEDALRIFDS